MKPTYHKICRSFAAASLAFFSSAAMAGLKVFEAEISESSWLFSGNPLECSLTHEIPYFGDAAFKKVAGKEEKLDFLLGYKRQALNTSETARVIAIAPAWQPSRASRELGKLPIQSGNYLIKTQDIASWKLLSELEIGRFPTFSYQEFNELEDQVSVSLSTIGFKNAYDQFLDCLTSLVPYKLDELSEMTLLFDFAKDSINADYRDKLQALAAYLRYDPEVEVVLIDGYTDNKGSRYYNDKLAQRRIDSVKQILTLEGTDPKKFKTHAFGERKPLVSNRTEKGRAQNRRVNIRILQG